MIRSGRFVATVTTWLPVAGACLATLLPMSDARAQTSCADSAELAVLPADMTPRQWVAHAGLDPRQVESGTSLHKPTRISKTGNAHLRAALYMPAMVAIREEPHVNAFAAKLIGRGKKPIQAIVAVERKLLHAIHGMWTTDTNFDGPKFYVDAA